MSDNTVIMNRRHLLAGLAAGAALPMTAGLSGCQTNPATGRNQMMLVSDGELAQLAEGAWRQALQKSRRTSNRALARRVERTGTQVVDVATRMYPRNDLGRYNWEFAVFEDDQVNAWVMPGGKVGFYSGILDIMENDDQVATVMAHEVGHVVGRHAAERYSQQIAAAGALTAANVALANSDTPYARQIAGVLGAGVTFGVLLPYSRTHEYEADRLGVDMMARANYRPREALAFWQTMTARDNRQPMEWMSTHPSDRNRIAAMESHMRAEGYV